MVVIPPFYLPVEVGIHEQLMWQPNIMHSLKDGVKSLMAILYMIE